MFFFIKFLKCFFFFFCFITIKTFLNCCHEKNVSQHSLSSIRSYKIEVISWECSFSYVTSLLSSLSGISKRIFVLSTLPSELINVVYASFCLRQKESWKSKQIWINYFQFVSVQINTQVSVIFQTVFTWNGKIIYYSLALFE